MLQNGQKNCIIDCRVSDASQLKGGSLDDQEKVGRLFAEKNVWNVIRVFKRFHSATTINRDDIEEIKKFIKNSKVKIHFSFLRVAEVLIDLPARATASTPDLRVNLSHLEFKWPILRELFNRSKMHLNILGLNTTGATTHHPKGRK